MGNCGRYDFYYNIYFFYEKPKTKQPALRDMLRHFHGIYSHRLQLSTNQRSSIRSVIVKSILVIDKAIGYDCNTDLTENSNIPRAP